jgi:acyl-CoA synthetase (NDP forming)/RimJ/RimL family protein N-acetyltransferase
MVDLPVSVSARSDYPTAWDFDALLTDGRAIRIRPSKPSDAARLITFHQHLSPYSVYHRYFGVHPAISENEARHVVEVDYAQRMCFVAEIADQFVGFASYEQLGPNNEAAEVSFCIADEMQHRGAATLLFESLAAYAKPFGIARFVAQVMTDNVAMLDLFGASGLESKLVRKDGTAYVDIELAMTPRYAAACDAREAVAEAASMAFILQPRSLAVVGASRRPGNAGHELVRSLLAGDFAGTVYPVNPHAESVCGVPAWPSLSSLPKPVDLVVVAVKPDLVRDIVLEAAAVGTRGMVIVSAGFGETGAEGAALESEVLAIARRSGMRVVGPNCLGVVNTDPMVRMNATFADLGLLPGHLALISQSGAVGLALAHQAKNQNLGLSMFVSVGNKLDVSSNDLLCFLERDERTSIIALYLESFGNPRKFARIASRVGRTKPIVALTAGRSSAGSRGARSHTAAAATPDVAVSALLKRSGVIKVQNLDELLDVSAVLLAGHLPQGRRVGLVGNSGGPLILAADACEAEGLSVPELGEKSQAALRGCVDQTAAVANPVDLTAEGRAEALEKAIAVLLNDDDLDALIVVVTELPALTSDEVRSAVNSLASTSDKPVVLCVLGDRGKDAREFSEIATPERAATALRLVSDYAQWRQDSAVTSSSEYGELAMTNATVRGVLEAHPDGGWLEIDVAARLLQSCGIDVVGTYPADDADDAVQIAESLGFPVALKARAGAIVHKSDVGGVALALQSSEDVRDAFNRMAAQLGAEMCGAVVQRMAPQGVEAIVGVATDSSFGPVAMVGLGGVLTDLLGDHAFGVPPLSSDACNRMVESLRAAPLLDGYRGSPKVDRASLVHLLYLVGQLADELPELVELDLNPVIVHAGGATVVDCKLRLGATYTGPGPLFRALRARR